MKVSSNNQFHKSPPQGHGLGKTGLNPYCKKQFHKSERQTRNSAPRASFIGAIFKQLVSNFRLISAILVMLPVVSSTSLASSSNESAPFTLDLRLSFEEWTLAAGVPLADAQADTVAGPLGVPNLVAYALGLKPREVDVANLPRLRPDPEVPDAVIFTYTLNRDSVGVSVRIEQSADLVSWSEVTPLRDEFIEELADGVEKRAIQIKRDTSAGGGLFLRVSVEAANP